MTNDQENKIHLVPMKDIKMSSCNVRLTDKAQNIKELADSIKSHGLLQPVVLRGTLGQLPYELIIGTRRYLAHKMNQSRSIKAVFAGELDDITAKIISLSENMHRVELNHADKAEAITALYLHYNRNERRVAREIDLPLRTVRDYIKIEELATPKAKKLLRSNKISKADVKRVIEIAQSNRQKADRLIDEIAKLTKYEKTRAVNYGKQHQGASATKILAESKKPKKENIVILSLTKDVLKALNKAEKKLSLDKELIATKALNEWLQRNGFLD